MRQSSSLSSYDESVYNEFPDALVDTIVEEEEEDDDDEFDGSVRSGAVARTSFAACARDRVSVFSRALGRDAKNKKETSHHSYS